MFTVIVSVGDRDWGCAFSRWRCLPAFQSGSRNHKTSARTAKQSKGWWSKEEKRGYQIHAFSAHGLQLTRPLFLSLLHTHTHTHSFTLTHTLIHIHTHSLYVFLCLSLSLYLTHTYAHTLCIFFYHTPSLTHTHIHILSLYLTLISLHRIVLSYKQTKQRGLLTCEHEVPLYAGSDQYQHQQKQSYHHMSWLKQKTKLINFCKVSESEVSVIHLKNKTWVRQYSKFFHLIW